MSTTKGIKAAVVTEVCGEIGKHSFTHEETEAFTDHINRVLADDKDLKNIIPIEEAKLFDAVKDGVLLCKLINSSVPGTIDERVINIKENKNIWEKNENHRLTINSAQGIGCSTVNVNNSDLNEGRPHIILGIVWQIIKIGLFQNINLKHHPELVRLLKEGEDLNKLLQLPTEELLLRWFNYQLEQAGSSRRVKNFSGDIKDSENYTTLLKQVCPKQCDDSPMKESDPKERAEKMLQQADKIGCRKFVTPRDVVNGNPKLNLAFVANLFNNYPALDPINEEEYDFAELMDFDNEGTREERSFRFWIQSLGINTGNNLFEDAKNGLLILRVEDKVKPGIIDWKKVDQAPKMKLHAIQNANLSVKVADEMKIKTVNIGGVDIVDGKKKQILGMIWQLMRYNLLSVLKEIGGGKSVDEQDILKWSNQKVASVGGSNITQFRDASLKTGVYLCHLCLAISPKSVNKDFITSGETPEEAEQNAKYAISVARKIGATVFLLWEDIVELNPKMILSFVASLMLAAENTKQQE